MSFANILIVGCGNMAGAMLEGWLAAGMEPGRFTIASPSEKPFPVSQHRTIPASVKFDAILLGVKPQKLGEVAAEVEVLAGPETTVLSLLAGVTLGTLAEAFPRAGAVARVMPNLAVALGKSPVAIAALGLDTPGQDALTALMDPLGTPDWVGEDVFDLVTALAGSGPAFTFRFIDALAAAASELGLPRDQADRLALAMVEGAAALAAESPHDPGELARRVASPGGMTQRGLDVLDADEALVRLMTETLRAARDRGAELAAEVRRKG
ncbi:pyrroline-5-carboxylate reductase [Altererythrobacter salegens]|uniref:Pyrroline-5-carboxylate reductase n=1 Tax=Croceibacterium salegens TaxID=1737568 RepID=A0A6I4SRI4_9SPHN|nr:pyrroline-5-carboxylate reductase dimerization domain-containing protein [Croceibacterium salegens]MXO58018.1 pyrroline-5-carboxylate reductase [Croceibacterium salegens]